jgi:hypothetical protein
MALCQFQTSEVTDLSYLDDRSQPNFFLRDAQVFFLFHSYQDGKTHVFFFFFSLTDHTEVGDFQGAQSPS